MSILDGTECSADFLLDFRHSYASLSQIVRHGTIRVSGKAQDFSFMDSKRLVQIVRIGFGVASAFAVDTEIKFPKSSD